VNFLRYQLAGVMPTAEWWCWEHQQGWQRNSPWVLHP